MITNDSNSDRRNFLRNMAMIGATTILNPEVMRGNELQLPLDKFPDGTTFLFQGDSITDGGRGRNEDWNHVMGQDYAFLISSKLWYEFPKKHFNFLNRGVSGNSVRDLDARWQQDTVELKPDVLSILVGINDIDYFLKGDKIFTAFSYENGYRSLLEKTKASLPGVQLIICEPFILRVGRIKDRWQEYFEEIKKRQAIVKQLAIEFNAVFIPFQKTFDDALSKALAEYWIWDGIHPMPAGHELMAREWIKVVSKNLKFI